MTRILLVDDELEIVFLTKKMLEKEGYDVRAAKNGKQCMAMLEESRPDLILLDIMMPGENGWDVCRKIKENNKTKAIPVVMFTVRASEDEAEISFEYAHADAQINKPFEMEELLRVIREILKE